MTQRDVTALLFDALRAIIPPGGDIGYAALLEALKAQGFDTSGIGVKLDPLHFRDYRGEWRGSEFIVYRVPTFDREVAGDWTEGELRVKRQEAPDNE